MDTIKELREAIGMISGIKVPVGLFEEITAPIFNVNQKLKRLHNELLKETQEENAKEEGECHGEN